MRALLTVIGRELIARPRHRWFYSKRGGLVIGVVLVLGFVIGVARDQSGGLLGLRIARTMSHCLVLIVLLTAPYLAASDLLGEKEQRTLPVLWMTDMTSATIILGRLFSALLISLSIVLMLLPLLLLGVAFGGVGSQQILQLMAILVSLAFLGTAFGLLVGAIARNERSMRAMLLFGILLVALLLPLLGLVGYAMAEEGERLLGLSSEAGMRIIGATSSFFAAEMLYRAVPPAFSGVAPTWWNTGFNLLGGAACLLLAALTFPWLVRNYERPSLQQRLKAWRQRRRGDKDNRRTSPPIEGNALFWKEYHKDYGGTRKVWLRMLLGWGALILVIIIGYVIGEAGRNGPFNWDRFWTNIFTDDFVGGVAMASYVLALFIWPLALISGASRMFAIEKRQQALEVLLTCDLNSAEIVNGKYLGLLLASLPWAVLGCTSILVLWGMSGFDIVDDAPSIILVLLAHYLGVTVVATSFAGWASLRGSRNAAFGLAIVGIIVYHFVLGFIMPAVGHESAVMAILGFGALVAIMVGIGFQHALIAALRDDDAGDDGYYDYD